MVDNSPAPQTFFAKPIRKQKRISSVSDLSRLLLNEEKSQQFFYRAALSHLISYVSDPKNRQKASYYDTRAKLALKVLEIGTKQYAAQDKILNSTMEKQSLANTLYLCELLAGIESPKWKAISEANKDSEYIELRHYIRSSTANTNWYRLYAIRLKRVFVSLMPLIKSIQYQKLIHQLQALDPILSYVAWIFYVPRLVTNLIHWFLHTVPGSWMHQEEKLIGIKIRAQNYWDRLWFELLNDGVWCFVGLMCCFVLDGPHALILTVALYFFDVVMAFVNASLNSKHHEKLLGKFKAKLSAFEALIEGLPSNFEFDMASALEDEVGLLKEYQSHIDLWLAYEEQKLVLSVQVTTALAMAMTIGVLPTLFSLGATLSVLCPIFSAMSVVAICTMQYLRSYEIESKCPNTNIRLLRELELKIGPRTSNDAPPPSPISPILFRGERGLSPFTFDGESSRMSIVQDSFLTPKASDLKEARKHLKWFSEPNELWAAADDEQDLFLSPVLPSPHSAVI